MMTNVSLYLVGAAWLIMNVEPYLTNKFYYYSSSDPRTTAGDVGLFKILSCAKSAILLITWCIAASNNKSSYGEIEVEPEGEDGASDDDDADREDEDSEGDGDA